MGFAQISDYATAPLRRLPTPTAYTWMGFIPQSGAIRYHCLFEAGQVGLSAMFFGAALAGRQRNRRFEFDFRDVPNVAEKQY